MIVTTISVLAVVSPAIVDDAFLVKLVIPSAAVVLAVVMLYGTVTVTGTVNKQPLLGSALSVAVTIVKCDPGGSAVGSTCTHVNRKSRQTQVLSDNY
jgi:hypothetical protein